MTTSSLSSTEHDHSIRLRSYQHEMYERSMGGNVMVAMDTGSGKTHVALLRIRTEVERNPGKLVWFLAPTVALCEQQEKSISTNLPAVRVRLLTSSDNVERWSEQKIWDAALANIELVVSTHAVLSDALAHGFVEIATLSLLIFDEAHHCNRGHPANKIMRDFYHPRKVKHGPMSVPHILGLTASPVLRSKISELSRIEGNLDSISITPRVHRQELLKHVHRPEIFIMEYESVDAASLLISSAKLEFLKTVCENNAGLGPIAFDPEPEPGKWRPSVPKPRSVVQEQIWKFFVKATHICEELGPWAADFFISGSISVLRTQNRQRTNMLAHGTDSNGLLRLLDHGCLSEHYEQVFTEFSVTSPKVQQLLSFLARQDHTECSGIVFVQQRATASVLCTLLSVHPLTKDRFKCATFVGMANSGAKKYAMTELLDLKAQREILGEFRSGRKNLIIATDALEEGIDISACNLVICFSPPANLKSFIQRRGRARQIKSQFVMMFASNDKQKKVENWRSLEDSLIRAYQSDLREVDRTIAIEAQEEAVLGELRSSMAVLTPADTMAHLHHFCACLPQQPYVDLKPIFHFDEDSDTKLVTARVELPNCLDASVRCVSATRFWRTEKAAMKDAAFQAYAALNELGLLNENLLPLSRTLAGEHKEQSERAAATTEVARQFSPWKALADAWSTPTRFETRITLREGPSAVPGLSINLTLPLLIPAIPVLDLYWNHNSVFGVHFDTWQEKKTMHPDAIRIARLITRSLMRIGHSDHVDDRRDDFIALFNPQVADDQLAAWHANHCGRIPALQQEAGRPPPGFIRPRPLYGVPYIFDSWQVEDMVKLGCVPLAKRRNFIRRIQDVSTISTERKVQFFPVEDCTIDLLPLEYAQFGLFIPAILQHLEGTMVAVKVLQTVLREVPINDVRHVVTAISAPSVGWASDYQTYEFFGDTVLKFVVSFQLFCDKKSWHEGCLSIERTRLVSNHRLAEAATLRDLDKYIMTEPFKSRGWSPSFISDLKSQSSGTRTLPTKLLADVVEALIGAAYLDGGLDSSRKCVHLFLPEISTSAPSFPRYAVAVEHQCDKTLREAESFLGRPFVERATLLEALTHPSCQADAQTESYQRLEYLGDAVLDMLVTSYLATYRGEKAMSAGEMTHIKAALVNEQFLGYLCLATGANEMQFDIHEKSDGTFAAKESPQKRCLWQLMRFNAAGIVGAQTRTQKRFAKVSSEIALFLKEGDQYPWLQLSRLGPEKFYSDIVESLIGAIFVDSNGSLSECDRFLDRMGFLSYMNRMADGQVDVTHPRNILAKLAKAEEVKFDVQQRETEGEEKRYSCSVKVGQMDIAMVYDCQSKDEATIYAALEATRRLKDNEQAARRLTHRHDLPLRLNPGSARST